MKFKNRIDIIENTDIESAPVMRRVGATLIDFALFFLLFFLIGLAVRPIFNATTDMVNITTTYQHSLKKSGLVTLDTPLSQDYSNIDEVKVTLNSVEETRFASATYTFYTRFMGENHATETDSYDHEWYLLNILKIDESNAYFVRVVEGTIDAHILASSDVSTSETTSEEVPTYDTFLPTGVALKSTTTATDVQTFYRTIYSGAIGVFNGFEFVREYRDILFFESTLNMLVAASIVYLSIPLFLRNGQTIGKLIFRLGLSDNHGYRVRWGRIVGRAAIFFLVYLFTLQIQPFIWLILTFVSLTMTIFSRKALGLHDYMSFSRVVDLKKSIIHEDVHAFIAAHPPVENMVDNE